MNNLDPALIDPIGEAEIRAAATRAVLTIKGVLPNPQKWWPFQPNEKQRTILDADYVEVFYGGAAAGGKSALQLMAASKYVDYGNYRALILRRTTKALKEAGGLVDLSYEFFANTGARYYINEMEWRFPSGAVIKLGFLEHDNHLQSYTGGAYHYIGFDELSQFPKKHYDFMFSRLRKRKDASHIPLRMYSTSNPDPSAMWIYDHFVKGATKVGSHTYFKTQKSSDGDTWQTVFVPAKLEDNPGVDRETYVKSLDRLDPVTRKRLLDGDWLVKAKGDIYKIMEPWHVITKSQFANVYGVRDIPAYWRKGMATDWGNTYHSGTGSVWVTRPPKYMPYPECKFAYRELCMHDPIPDEYVTKVAELEGPTFDSAAMDFRIMSHDKLDIRNILERQYQMYHSQAVHSVREGIGVIQNELRIIGRDKIHPFKPDTTIKGYPLLMLIVDDDEGETYLNPSGGGSPETEWVVTPGRTAAGLVNLRNSMAWYRWKESESGKEEPEHDQLGLLDALRMIGWRFFPTNASKTKEELEDETLPEIYRIANISKVEDIGQAGQLYHQRQMQLAMNELKKKAIAQANNRPNSRSPVWASSPIQRNF